MESGHISLSHTNVSTSQKLIWVHSVYCSFITLVGVIDMDHFIEPNLYIHFAPWKTSWLKDQPLNYRLGFLKGPVPTQIILLA